MNLIFAGLSSSFLAFITNRYLVKKLGNKAIIFIIPLLEEIFKTGSYYFFAKNLLLVHLIFGIVEGLFDYYNSKIAALSAILSHLTFGYITLLVWEISYSLLIGVFFSALVHILWNYIVGRIVK